MIIAREMCEEMSVGVTRSRLSAQGRTLVPPEIRKRLGLEAGSFLEWHEEDGKIVVRRADSCTFEDIHKKLFKAKIEPKSLDELKEGIEDYMRKEHPRR